MPKTILRILDQVNVKFDNLDPHTRRKMVESLKFFLPNARHTPSYKLGRWDGTISFANVSGATYLNLLEVVLPIVVEAGYEIEIQDERPQYNFDFKPIDENFLAHKVWPKGHPLEGKPIMMRDYQVNAVNTYLSELCSLQTLSTGCGKCVTGETLMDIEVDADTPFGKFLLSMTK